MEAENDLGQWDDWYSSRVLPQLRRKENERKRKQKPQPLPDEAYLSPQLQLLRQVFTILLCLLDICPLPNHLFVLLNLLLGKRKKLCHSNLVE